MCPEPMADRSLAPVMATPPPGLPTGTRPGRFSQCCWLTSLLPASFCQESLGGRPSLDSRVFLESLFLQLSLSNSENVPF